MPTPHRRLHVTLTPELEAVLTDLSGLTGRPQAALVRELLVEGLPGLQAMAEALRMAYSGKPREAVDQMLGVLERETREARQMGLELRQKRRRKRVP